MASNKKKAREGAAGPSQNPRNPRKGKEGKGRKAQTARSRQVRESAQTDVDGLKAWTERVVDTIDLMFRARQIDADQRQAAGLYRDAWELTQGGIACPLDIERVRGSGIPSPTESQLMAARRLAEAAQALGRFDTRLVSNIVCEGRSIEETAGALLGMTRQGRPSQRHCDHVGQRLRLALTQLVELWGIAGAGRRRGHGRICATPPPVTSPATGGRTIERGRVVHATARKVYDV